MEVCRGNDLLISTHSLTRRLTPFLDFWYCFNAYFNSQPHEEADSRVPSASILVLTFQLTASRGG